MAFPPTCTLIGTYTDSSGNPAQGQLTFTPSAELIATSQSIVLPVIPVTVFLTGGTFSLPLLPTDTANVTPTGWSYLVTETIQYTTNSVVTAKYYIKPTGTGTINIASLAQYTAAPTVTAYGSLAANNTWTGANTFTGELIAPTPVNATDASTKAYSDAKTLLNVKQQYGATGNGVMLTSGAMTASSPTLTASTATFTTADVGKQVVVMGANTLNGSLGTPLPATISAFISSTQVTLSASAVNTVSGATFYYGTDDKTALQNAINAVAVGQGVFLPQGIYLMSGELSITQPMRLTGDGATIVTTNSAAINFQNTYITAASGSSTSIGLEIDHLVFDCSGGHVLYNCNWNKFSLHDLRLVQRSYNFAVWYSTAQNVLDADVRNVVTRVYGNTRSVQAWYFRSALGGGIAMWRIGNCLFQNNDLDATQYFVWIECEDASNHSYTNDLSFEHCWFDSAYGGCVKLVAAQGAAFRSCNIIDSFAASWGNSGYYIGAATSNGLWASQKISFLDCGRDLSGPNGSTTWDIYCESTTDSVTIQNYAIRDTVQPPTNTKPQFNFNGCTNVVLLNDKYRIITNAPSTSVELLDGNVSLTGSLTGNTLPYVPLPSDHGFIAWSQDPATIGGTTAFTVGGLVLMAQYIRAPATVSNVVLMYGGTTGVGLTNSFVGLYNSAGTLLSGSADQSSNWMVTGQAAGIAMTIPLTSPQTITTPGLYWVGALIGAATTSPVWARGATNPQNIMDVGQGANIRRFGLYSSALTALPSTITPTSIGTPGAAFWAAVK